MTRIITVPVPRMLSWRKRLRENPVREDKVARVRAEIEAGTYENDRKLGVSADRILYEWAWAFFRPNEVQ